MTYAKFKFNGGGPQTCKIVSMSSNKNAWVLHPSGKIVKRNLKKHLINAS